MNKLSNDTCQSNNANSDKQKDLTLTGERQKLISVDRVKKIIKETCFVDAGRFGVIVNATELIEAIDKEPSSECQRCKELETFKCHIVKKDARLMIMGGQRAGKAFCRESYNAGVESQQARIKELEWLLREANKHIEHHAIDSSLWRKIKQALGDV
jgi:hypothetical protein